MSEIQHLIQAFSWNSPSWDLFIFLGWLAVSAIYAFTAGRGRIINILLSTYIAKLLVFEAPMLTNAITKNLPESLVSVQQLVTFAILFLLLFIFLGRFAFRTAIDGRQLNSIFFGLIFAVLQVGLLISIVLNYLPAAARDSLSELVHAVFIRNPAGFVWLVTPLGYLMFLGRHVADTSEI